MKERSGIAVWRARAGSTGGRPPAVREPVAPLAMIDPGWLFLIAGLALLAATMLIPAFDDLGEVRWQRDRALMIEHHRIARLDRHGEYLGALHREEPALLIALAASQLNQIPEGKTPVLETAVDAASSASVFDGLEPPPALLPERRRVGSILEWLATGERRRPWLLGASGMCLLVGLLPRTIRR